MQVDVQALLVGICSKGTIIAYSSAWDDYVKFAGSTQKALNGPMLVRWRQAMAAGTLSAASINLRMAGVKTIVRELYGIKQVKRETYWAIKEVKKLPSTALKERRRPNNRTRIEPEVMRKLCKLPPVSEENAVALRDRALMMVMATTGARIAEVLNMRVKDIVALPNNQFVVMNILGKTDSDPRTVPLSPEANSAVADWLEFRPIKSPFIFTSFHYDYEAEDILYSETPMSHAAAYHRIKMYGRMMGLPTLKCHDFRRFVGTQLAKKDIRLAQKVLGHSSIETTVAHYVLDEFEPGTTDNLF